MAKAPIACAVLEQSRLLPKCGHLTAKIALPKPGVRSHRDIGRASGGIRGTLSGGMWVESYPRRFPLDRTIASQANFLVHLQLKKGEAEMRPSAITAIVGCFTVIAMAEGCSTVIEQRVETRLVEAGIPTGMASCMAEIWADDLSVAQIREISRFADAVRDDEQTLTVGKLVDHVREWNDPQALGVVSTSAARCAFG